MASDNVFSFAIATASPKGGTLEQMLANTTNCYKYVWMLALLRIASENKREFVSFKEMTARMVAAAWYPVIYFRLNLGYSDQLAELIYAVREECHLPDDSSYDDIVAAVMGIQNPDVEKKIRMMTRYVPQRFIAAVFNDQYAEYRKEFGKSFESKKDNLTRDLSQKAMNAGRTPYVISKDGIQLTPEWTRYFIENNPIITECTYFKLTQFLQQKNPSVLAISEKLIQPTSRNSLDFSRAKDYWRSAIERDGDVYDIYTLRHFTKDALESLGPMSVDHFVPWKFVLHDQIWNLVPTFRSPNSSKNDNLPDTAYLDDFCSVQFIGLTANRETQHFRKVIESYRDVIPNAEQFVATLENKEAFSEKLKNAILPLLLQAKNQGFTDWTNTYRGV